MKLLLSLVAAALAAAPALSNAATLQPGTYRTAAGHVVYVGTEHELPDPAAAESFDPQTQRLDDVSGGEKATLVHAIVEERRVLQLPQGALGVSLYRSDVRRRATVILVHGNDPETREMGFLIPYFVCNGVNVISYDQRGTGESAGNWFFSGPAQRAADVDAIIDAYAKDPHIDAARMGVWGFSNGGWTAPLVATQRPLAFMILKSAPAETIADNLVYEVVQRMRQYGHTDAEVAQAVQSWRLLLDALGGTGSWDAAKTSYEAASTKPWFKDSLLLPGLRFPLSPAMVADFRKTVLYDPAPALLEVRTPTLALFGAKDRNVDVAHASTTLRADFAKAGMSDFTMHVYPDSGHTLKVSPSGYNGDASLPVRLSAGYPFVMIDWLSKRGFTNASAAASNGNPRV